MPKKRRNSKKKPRKRNPEKPAVTEVEEKVSKEELRARLRAKMNVKKLHRTSRIIRDQEMEDIEDKLDDKRLSGKEKKRLKERLKLLEEVEEQQFNAMNDDYAEYVDTGSYGGSMERPD